MMVTPTYHELLLEESFMLGEMIVKDIGLHHSGLQKTKQRIGKHDLEQDLYQPSCWRRWFTTFSPSYM